MYSVYADNRKSDIIFIENYFSDFVIEQQKEFVDRQLLITFQN